MRLGVVAFLAGLSLAAVAACLNPQPLPPEDGDPAATTSSSSGSSGFSSSSSGGKVDDGEIVPPAPQEGGVQGLNDGGDAESDAGTDGSPSDASDDGG